MEKHTYTKAQMADLQPAAPYFNTCIKAQYKRVTPRDLDELVAKIYGEVTGQHIDINSGCSRCVYNLYLQAGRLYFDTLKNKIVQKETEQPLKTNKLGKGGRNNGTKGKEKNK